jgi:diketogulonate reductase-like aldo/keto reductase
MASQTFSLTSRKSLPNTSSLSIPHIHLGVYLTSGSETRRAVQYALEAGYRAFDSAQMYGNEREVGSTILAYLKEHPELKREDIHYTSKLAENERSYEAVRESIRESVRECGLGYIDLFLLHSPYGGKEARLNSWKALEDAVLEGEVRIPGVSNYGEKHVSFGSHSLFFHSYCACPSWKRYRGGKEYEAKQPQRSLPTTNILSQSNLT